MPDATITELTSEIVAHYVSNNSVKPADLPSLIQTVFKSLTGVGDAAPQEPTVDMPTAAQIRKSIRSDGLVSFVDGKSYKTLKRHLTRSGLTIPEYKERFGLPKDYPTTSPEYSAKRSEMAKSLGLGRKAGGGIVGDPDRPFPGGKTAQAPKAKKRPEKPQP